MDINYWNKAGKNYESEIFSVYGNDKERIIEGAIAPLLNRRQTAADFGCGIGYFLPLLSKGFKKVHAIDFSAECLKKARVDYAQLSNVAFQQSDLAAGRLGFAPVDFGLCCNVLIAPSVTTRQKILQTLKRSLKRNGHLLLVVPSLESAMLAGSRLIEWNLKSGQSPQQAVRNGFDSQKITESKFYQGIIDIDGVGTKHFLREELENLLTDLKFAVTNITKIKYNWHTEFVNPPAWMKAPYPWDWLVTAQKR